MCCGPEDHAEVPLSKKEKEQLRRNELKIDIRLAKAELKEARQKAAEWQRRVLKQMRTIAKIQKELKR